MSVAVRRASVADEHEALAALAHRAFRYRDGALWGPYFRDHPNVRNGDVVVAEVGGDLAGTAVSLDLTITLRGVELAMGGLAAVSVAPEFRRRGVAGRMLHALLSAMPGRGQCVAGLHAVSLAFYRRAGFGLVEWVEELRARPGQVRAPHGDGHVRPWDRARDLDAMKACYDRWRRGRSGPLRRSDFWWDLRVLRGGEEAVVVHEGGALTGYALFVVPQEPAYPQQHLRVVELVAETEGAWGALLRWARSLDDQYRVISVDVPEGTARLLREDHGIPDAPAAWGDRDLGAVGVTGLMLRVTDLPAALASQARAIPAAVGLDVVDPESLCGGAWDLRGSPHGLAVTRGSSCGARLSISIDALTQVWSGAARASELRAMGFVRGPAEAAETLDALFPRETVFLSPRNYF